MYLKDFDLAGGRVEVLRVLSTVSQGKRVELDSEGDALLPAMFPGSELCTDAVHLQTAGETREYVFDVEIQRHARQMAQKGAQCACVCVCVLCG